jgi:predicted DNA-binding protein (UPF0251 family)
MKRPSSELTISEIFPIVGVSRLTVYNNINPDKLKESRALINGKPIFLVNPGDLAKLMADRKARLNLSA